MPSTTIDTDTRVVAVITTFNAEHTLRRVIRAIASQTTPVHRVVVANNGDPIEPGSYARYAGLDVRILNLGDNLGPAGGFHRGMQEAASDDFDYVWLFCDDIFPEPDCLRNLVAAVQRCPDPTIALGTVKESRGTFRYPAWTGTLVSRQVIDLMGLPLPDLFWWAEDTEYLQDRPARFGVHVVYPDDCIVYHAEERRSKAWPVWKYYYVSRNTLFIRAHYPGKTLDCRTARKIARVYVGLLGRIVVYNTPALLPSSRALVRGTVDGIKGDISPRPYVRRPNTGPEE